MVLLTKSLDGVPRRIVSLNPSVTEFLFLIGAGDSVVGVDAWSYRPREAMGKARIGSFISADMELIGRLRPDLIILSYPVQRHLVDELGKIAPVLAVPMPVNVDGVVSVFKAVGLLVDKDEEAERVVGVYRDLLRKEVDVDGVLVILSLGDFVIPCGATYMASALTMVGLRYVSSLKCIELILSKDDAIKVINDSNPNLVIYEGKTKTYRPQEITWINKPVIVTPNDTLAHFGPSLPLDLRLLLDALKSNLKFVDGTSSIKRPSLGDPWYLPYR